ncbi:MAG: GGDEF domain-containing protein [Nanoarchaeota archaeon]
MNRSDTYSKLEESLVNAEAGLNGLDDILSIISNENVPYDTKSKYIENVKDVFGAIRSFYSQTKKYAAELDNVASLDSLTKLYNRHGLDAQIDSIVNKCSSRSQGHLYSIFFDLNNFKKANDVFGHEIGDDALRTTSAEILANIESDDIACRYGGDEYLVVICANNEDNAQSVAERLMKKMNSRLIRFNEHYGTDVSVSAGITEWNPKHEHVDAAKSRADSAMYESKAIFKDSGENVVVYRAL